MGHQCISVRTNGNSNTHANRDSHPSSYSYADANADRNCDANSHTLPRWLEARMPLSIDKLTFHWKQ